MLDHLQLLIHTNMVVLGALVMVFVYLTVFLTRNFCSIFHSSSDDHLDLSPSLFILVSLALSSKSTNEKKLPLSVVLHHQSLPYCYSVDHIHF